MESSSRFTMDRTASLDGVSKGDDATIYAAKFAEKECDIKVNSFTIGWAVTTTQSERNKGADSFKVVLLPGEHKERLKAQEAPILHSPYLETVITTAEKFKKGRPLLSLSTPIHACVGKSRPRVLYRVVHDQHPGNGLRSRGFGTVGVDAISFMMHFAHHLDWRRRDASPFMSTTINFAKAATIAERNEAKEFKNIEILEIKVDESEWRRQSAIWHVRQTAAKLGLFEMLTKRWCDEHEYLIKDYIPASCVTRFRWEQVKADIKAEATEMRQSRKRKRCAFEPDGRGDGKGLGTGRSKRIWGVVENSRREGTIYYTWRDDLKK